MALQLLFQRDLNADIPQEDIEGFIQGRLQAEDLEAFCLSLFQGVCDHQKEIDEAINQVAQNWSLSRMAVVDRNVLRMGAYEILFTDTPNKAATNEAIDLVRRFGTAKSSAFVNGILDRLIQKNASPSS